MAWPHCAINKPDRYEKGALPNPLQLAVLINEHWNEGYLTKPPLLVQKVMFGALAPVGRLLGYKAHYPKYSSLVEPSSDEGAGPPSTTEVVARAGAMVTPILLTCFLLLRSKRRLSA